MPSHSSLTSSGCEARCPICGVTLSRRADVKRHLENKHPDGTESMFRCPKPNCRYETRLKANLRTHVNARHSNGPQYSCTDCGQRFTDPAATIRHRKKTHGYQPHHTKGYLASKALKGKESAIQGPGNEVSSTSRCQSAASDDPNSAPNALSLGAGPRDILRLAHRNDFWRTLVDFARRSTSEREVSNSQGDQHFLPFGAVPGHDAPVGIQSFSDGSIHQVAPTPTSISSSDSTSHGSSFLVPVSDVTVMPLQGQALTWPSTGFPDQFSNHSYGDGSQFITASYQSAPPLWQVPGLTVTPPQAVSTPLPQPDLFIPGQDLDFDSWFQLNI